jgi:hypothetical protein
MQSKDNFLRKANKRKTLKTLVNYASNNYGLLSPTAQLVGKNTLRRLVAEEDVIEEYLDQVDSFIYD